MTTDIVKDIIKYFTDEKFIISNINYTETHNILLFTKNNKHFNVCINNDSFKIIFMNYNKLIFNNIEINYNYMTQIFSLKIIYNYDNINLKQISSILNYMLNKIVSKDYIFRFNKKININLIDKIYIYTELIINNITTINLINKLNIYILLLNIVSMYYTEQKLNNINIYYDLGYNNIRYDSINYILGLTPVPVDIDEHIHTSNILKRKYINDIIINDNTYIPLQKLTSDFYNDTTLNIQSISLFKPKKHTFIYHKDHNINNDLKHKKINNFPKSLLNSITTPNLVKPTIVKPTIVKPTIVKPTIVKPTIVKPIIDILNTNNILKTNITRYNNIKKIKLKMQDLFHLVKSNSNLNLSFINNVLLKKEFIYNNYDFDIDTSLSIRTQFNSSNFTITKYNEPKIMSRLSFQSINHNKQPSKISIWLRKKK